MKSGAEPRQAREIAPPEAVAESEPIPVRPEPDPARVERRAFLAGITAIVLAFAWFVVRPLLAPLVFAVLTAVIAHPVHARIKRRLGGRGVWAALATIVLLTGMVGLPAVGLSSLVVGQAREVLEQILGAGEKRSRLAGLAQQAMDGLSQLAQDTVGDAVDVGRLVRESAQKLATDLSERIPALFNQAGQLAFGVLLLYLVLFVLLLRGRELLDLFVELAPMGEDHSRRILKRLESTIKGVFLGSLATAVIQLAVGALGFWLAGFQSHLIWGALLAAAGLIPIVGTGIIWIPAVLYLALSGQTADALWMLAIGGVVSSVDNLVKPLLIHERAAVHPLLVFIGLFGGFASFGAMGLIYGPLLVACLTEMVRIYRDDFTPLHRPPPP